MATKMKTIRKDILVMDPQCGKSVNRNKARSLRFEGKTFFFCSQKCKARFEVDPPGDAGF